ncbi:uncharacterized protein LOC144151971 [Haemaphysalis longicornis]
MCRILPFLAILVAAARSLPIADPKIGGIAPIDIDAAIQPEIIPAGEKAPIIPEKMPSTYTDAKGDLDAETGAPVVAKPYKAPEVAPGKPGVGKVVPEKDVKVEVAPVSGEVGSSFRGIPEIGAAEEKVDSIPIPGKAPTLSVGDIDTKDAVEGPNLDKVEGVPYEAKADKSAAGEDETTRDEKVPDGVEQYGSSLEFSKYDANGDGVINIDEWNIIHGGQEKIINRFHAADINGDKQLEQTEFQGASWYTDGEQIPDVARDALMLAIAEQAATNEHKPIMTAAVMPSTELRYIVDDTESSAQSVPVVPAEPVVVVPVEAPAAPIPYVPAPAAVVDDAKTAEVPAVPAAAVPEKFVTESEKPVTTKKKEKTEVPQVPEVVKDVQPKHKVEVPAATTAKVVEEKTAAVVEEKKPVETTILI